MSAQTPKVPIAEICTVGDWTVAGVSAVFSGAPGFLGSLFVHVSVEVAASRTVGHPLKGPFIPLLKLKFLPMNTPKKFYCCTGVRFASIPWFSKACVVHDGPGLRRVWNHRLVRMCGSSGANVLAAGIRPPSTFPLPKLRPLQHLPRCWFRAKRVDQRYHPSL